MFARPDVYQSINYLYNIHTWKVTSLCFYINHAYQLKFSDVRKDVRTFESIILYVMTFQLKQRFLRVAVNLLLGRSFVNLL